MAEANVMLRRESLTFEWRNEQMLIHWKNRFIIVVRQFSNLEKPRSWIKTSQIPKQKIKANIIEKDY